MSFWFFGIPLSLYRILFYKWIVILGVFIFLEASNNSCKRGTPKVTFLSETPAKWKVLRVIWVVGYPIDWAEIDPTDSPEGTRAWKNFVSISSINPIKPTFEIFTFSHKILLARLYLKWILKIYIPFYF